MCGFAVVDCETTGLRSSSDRIIEIAVLLLDDEGTTHKEWSSLINPAVPVTASFVHGLRDSDVAHAPVFADIAPRLADMLSGRVFVAHNSAFDQGFINAEFARIGSDFSIPDEACVCTLDQSRIYLPDGRHGLQALAQRIGLPARTQHRALDDARTCGDLLRFYMACEQRGERHHQSEQEARGARRF